jgi:hypothetical protein
VGHYTMLGVTVTVGSFFKLPEGEETLLSPVSQLRSPYGLLFFGIFSLFLAVAGTCTGEAWAFLGRVVCRAKEPKQFWQLIAIYYLGGICFIGYFLYKVYGLSN